MLAILMKNLQKKHHCSLLQRIEKWCRIQIKHISKISTI
ncbi:hypothetical protein D917_03280 [Trichinella nativa]|uniref:Uncharacterized protein n=1 Tax=Trichinella nativa TaxID=6335 RepID=A0A1Y3EEH0_9BILA|nr:hypothetical protein D917_03280 [Trichinella nativa]